MSKQSGGQERGSSSAEFPPPATGTPLAADQPSPGDDHLRQGSDQPQKGARRRLGRSIARVFSRPVRYAGLLAGALPVLAFGSLNLEFLAWFGLVPGLVLMRAAPTSREAAVRG
ncbi:MAG TPA: hypothetical protein VN961_07720, partial [Streptosporangiaceae bacterium]|nr:hypothetical protein [Streptosporangiaceae bacterium]